jgi:hypothetical protein
MRRHEVARMISVLEHQASRCSFASSARSLVSSLLRPADLSRRCTEHMPT